MNSILQTVKGAKFDISKPAKSNVCMVLDGKGRQVMDVLRITGNQTVINEGNQDAFSMVEVEHSFGIDEVNEDFLWQ